MAKNGEKMAKNGEKMAKNGKKWRLFGQTTANFYNNLIITLVFEKNDYFFRRKYAKIAGNCDHSIDPWFSQNIITI
jgi:hypothetical protein